MNTVSVRVAYRPFRVGLCIAENSHEDFRKAVRLAATLWGGGLNPIISIGSNQRQAEQIAKLFSVDLLYPASDTPEVVDHVKQAKHLPWPELRTELFVQGLGGPLPVLLDVVHPIRKLAEEREKQKQPATDGAYVLPNILTRLGPGTDPLQDALLATLGDYPDGAYCPINYGRFADNALGSDYLGLLPETPLPADYWNRLSPVGVTAHGLFFYSTPGGWQTPGIFVGDPASVADLVTFWNLRAAGIRVLFHPENEDERLVAANRNWVEKVKVRLAADPAFQRRPALWCTREMDASQYTGIFAEGSSVHLVSDGLWNGLNLRPSRLHFEQQSVLGTIDQADKSISVSFALPNKPFLDTPETQFQHAILTTRPIVDPNPTLGTFHLPYLPQLNEFYGRNAHFDGANARIEPDGLGIVLKQYESDLTIRGISALQLLAQVFELAKITARQSPAGKVALRVIQNMDDLEGCRVFKIKGVRKLLSEFSVSQHFSHRQALERIGPGFDAYKGLYIESRRHGELRAQDAFLHLVRKKVIRPGVELECSNCGLTDWHSLNDLAEQVDCPYCGTKIDSGPQLRDGMWQYRVSGVFARTREHEGAIPVTLALLQARRCLRMRSMVWLTGMDLRWDDSGAAGKAETDLVVMTENYENVPELLLGECKTSMELDEEQVDRLLAAARRCSASGIKTYVMFAKAGGMFSDKELELLDSRQTVDVDFILLTPAELEPRDPYEKVKSEQIRRSTPTSLEEWAQYSRILYLKTTKDEVLERHVADMKNISKQ